MLDVDISLPMATISLTLLLLFLLGIVISLPRPTEEAAAVCTVVPIATEVCWELLFGILLSLNTADPALVS